MVYLNGFCQGEWVTSGRCRRNYSHALMEVNHFILHSELPCNQRNQLLLLAPLISERGLDPGIAVSSLASFTVLVVDIYLDGAGAFGGRTGDFGSGLGIPSEP